MVKSSNPKEYATVAPRFSVCIIPAPARLVHILSRLFFRPAGFSRSKNASRFADRGSTMMRQGGDLHGAGLGGDGSPLPMN